VGGGKQRVDTNDGKRGVLNTNLTAVPESEKTIGKTGRAQTGSKPENRQEADQLTLTKRGKEKRKG